MIRKVFYSTDIFWRAKRQPLPHWWHVYEARSKMDLVLIGLWAFLWLPTRDLGEARAEMSLLVFRQYQCLRPTLLIIYFFFHLLWLFVIVSFKIIDFVELNLAGLYLIIFLQ